MISRELALVIRCCRGNFASGGQSVPLDPGRTDWGLFLRLVRFHRVQGLVWSRIDLLDETAPASIAEALAADARSIAADNMLAAIECRGLRDSFAAAGVPLLFVKGLTVGQLAYGRIGVKAAIDIDVLTSEASLLPAAAVLTEAGYALQGPCAPASVAGLAEWHRAGKESTWIRKRDGAHVDLHTRLSDHRGLIPAIGVDSPRQLVEVAPGIALPTLRDAELFAYLCIHGASSAWFRLKWITDVAALLDKRAAGEIAQLYRCAQQLGAGRAAAQTLLLADRLYATLRHEESLRKQLSGDRAARLLFQAAMGQVTRHREPLEPTSRRFGTAMIHLTQLLLAPGWAFPISEAARQVRAALR